MMVARVVLNQSAMIALVHVRCGAPAKVGSTRNLALERVPVVYTHAGQHLFREKYLLQLGLW